VAGGDRGAVRGVRPHAPRDRDDHRRPPSRSGAGAGRSHRGARARHGDLDRRLVHAQRGPCAEEEGAVAVNERVAIVGSGLIGRAWAIVFAGGGCDVALYDPGPGVAGKASGLVAEELHELAALGLVADAKAAAARMRVAASLAEALAGATFVQECAPET